MESNQAFSLTSLLVMDPDPSDEEAKDDETQKILDQIAEEGNGYCCAAEDKCGMNNTPFTAGDFHRCKTCDGRVHGIFCCVRQYEDEEGSIFYCLKCGRPEDGPPKDENLPKIPKKKAVPTSTTYNLRQNPKRKHQEAAKVLSNLAKTPEPVSKMAKTSTKTSENFANPTEMQKMAKTSAKPTETFAKPTETFAKTTETLAKTTEKQIENPKKSIKRPTKIADVKGYNVARIFEVTARQVSKLQVSTTWEDEEDRQEKPSCHYALLSCDEMLAKPFEKERYKRKAGQEQITLQAYQGFDHKKWGGRIKQMGADMEKGKRSGKNWKIVDNVQAHHNRIFGSTMKFRPYGGDKKQADTYNDLLGPGYDRVDEGSKKPAAKKSGGKKSLQKGGTKTK